jgi:hypothetical protein
VKKFHINYFLLYYPWIFIKPECVKKERGYKRGTFPFGKSSLLSFPSIVGYLGKCLPIILNSSEFHSFCFVSRCCYFCKHGWWDGHHPIFKALSKMTTFIHSFKKARFFFHLCPIFVFKKEENFPLNPLVTYDYLFETNICFKKKRKFFPLKTLHYLRLFVWN